MKIILTGAGGMLGKALMPSLDSRGHIVKGMPKEELDVTNYSQVNKILNYAKPDLVVHCAAYTKVDQAETEPDLAYLINGYGTENIAVICSSLNIPMLYISTDYVFDGRQNRPYTPWDQTNPLSVYGKSKLAGELAVQRHLRKFYIVRTSWLYGPHGNHFVGTILKMADAGKPLRVVSDQWGSPTCTLSLSEVLGNLIATNRWGVYHATDGGVTNWYDFARAIVADKGVNIQPINTEDFPRPATRPKYSVLDKTTLIQTTGKELMPWQNALKLFMETLPEAQPVRSSSATTGSSF